MRTIELILSPREAFDDDLFQDALYRKASIPRNENVYIQPVKRSIDARGRNVIVRIQCELLGPREQSTVEPRPIEYRDVKKAPEVIVVGSGPAGLFAALRLIELGHRPIVLERGKDVQSRRRDLAAINKDQTVNPESNYCFGEGGAGTYSDGKLYTRSKKRGDIRKILEVMVAHGARPDILFDAHPHIGTNKLPVLVAALRDTIIRFGGEVHFNTRVDDFIIEGSELRGVVTNNNERIQGGAVILATGHSARDIFELLHRHNILIEAKPFALGLRVEHHQKDIDKIQYHTQGDRDPWLPASSYALVHQASVNGRDRGVFSFCMCPGGFIVPSATQNGEVVVNGMSPSRRDSLYANSGIVVTVDADDFAKYSGGGPLAGLRFQSAIEQKACEVAGNTQQAPAQRLVDFVNGRTSASLPDTSYQPGVVSADMKSVLPKEIHNALRQGFRNFGTRMQGYLSNEALVLGVESRTSSPVKIPRDKDSLEHPALGGLFPCGEGAGFAGGIVSAAMDGERCAEAVVRKLGGR
ncbi:FAD-binding protein [Chryseolinea sp. T2]|uniref:NAD(P)/FAD-dependent oxidoreductase n=1 Tax=Chryseolinea sp. T2 TaxID=3129255 RepID=UPI0030786BA5